MFILLIFNSVLSIHSFGMWNVQLSHKSRIGFKLENKVYEGFTTPCLIYYWIFLYLNIVFIFSLLQKSTKNILAFYFLNFLTFISINFICFCCCLPVDTTARSVLQPITLRVHIWGINQCPTQSIKYMIYVWYYAEC